MKARVLATLTLLVGAAGISLFATPAPYNAAAGIFLYNTGSKGSATGCIGTSTLSAGCTLSANGDTSITGWTLQAKPAASTASLSARTATSGGAPFTGSYKWLADNSTSTWLSPSGSPDTAGWYTYRLQFNLTAAQAAKTVLINGRFASDDEANMSLNGTAVDSIQYGFGAYSSWRPFVIDNSSGYNTGVNTLDIQVRNRTTGVTGFSGAQVKGDGGLRVEFSSVTVPEGGEIVGLTMGLGMVLFAWKRKKDSLLAL